MSASRKSGVGDGDQQLRPFPGGPAGQVHSAVLGDDVIGLASGVRDNVPGEVGHNSGPADAALVHEGRDHADEGLPAPGHGGPGEVVQLAPRAADVPQSGAFRTGLPVEVYGDAAVDGDHVVQLGDGLRGVDVLQGGHGDRGILVHPVVEGLGAEDDARHALVPVDGLPGIGQLSGLVQLIVGVAAELRVHPQVLQVRLG